MPRTTTTAGLAVTENRQKVRDLIATLPPEKFDMRAPSTCGFGTAACIMGWAEMLMQPDPTTFELFADAEVGKWLGLDANERRSLFYPMGIGLLHHGGSVYDATPADAVRVLDHLIATGEVDWSVAAKSGAA